MSLFIKKASLASLRQVLLSSCQTPIVGSLLFSPRTNHFLRAQSLKQFSIKVSLLAKGPPKSPRTQRAHPQEIIHEEYTQPPPPPPQQNAQASRSFDEKTAQKFVGAIVGLCGGVWIYEQVKIAEYKKNPTREARKAIEKFYKYGVLSPQNIREGRYYTMITSAFMHGSLMHLIGNMFALWSFGPGVILMYGYPGFVGLYLSSAVVGSAAQLLAYKWKRRENVGAVGASGAVSGMVAAFACAAPFHKMLLMFIPMQMITGLSLWTLFSIGGLQGWWAENLGHGAHLGGTAMGVLWWFAVMRRRPLGPTQYVKWLQHTMGRSKK